VPSRGVNNDYLVLLLPEELDTFLRNLDWVGLPLMSEERTFNFCCVHLELLESTSSEGICADQTYFPVLLHIVEGKLGAGGGFSGTLKSDKHDNVGLSADELVGSKFAS